MTHRFFCTILLFFWGFSLSPLVSTERSETLYQQANRQYHQFLSKRKLIPQEKWMRLIRDFEHIQKNFPASLQAPISLLRVGILYRQLFLATDHEIYLNRGLRTLRQLIEVYPQTTLADDGQFIIGEIFEEDKKETTLALLEYNKVLQYNGDQKNKALKKIKQLRKKNLPTLHLFEPPKARTNLGKKHQGGISIDQSRALPKAKILSVQSWATAKWARIVINSSRPIPYLYRNLPPIHSQKSEPLPLRFYVDFLDSQSTISVVASLQEEGRFIHNVEFQALNPRITRLTFTLDHPISLKVFDYQVSHQNVITLEMTPEKPKPFSFSLRDPPKQTISPSFIKQTIKRIIIDPGHGGRDPGASGFGIDEKDIVLAIAHELKKLIEKKTSLKVFLTRSTDRFLSLEARSALARQYKGDLFISLHVNAHPVQEAHGIESYFLDVTDDQSSMKLAIRENNMSDQGLHNFTMILRDLLNLSQSSQSARLTHSIHNQLLRNIRTNFRTGTRNLGVKEAPFLILLGVGMPATLLEISFITNPEENRRLQDTKYYQTISEGIFQGIQDYVLQQKPG